MFRRRVSVSMDFSNFQKGQNRSNNATVGIRHDDYKIVVYL